MSTVDAIGRGALVWWQMSGVSVSPAVFLKAMTLVGLVGEAGVETPKTALSKVAGSWSFRLDGCKTRAKIVGRHDDGTIEVGFTKEWTDKTKGSVQDLGRVGASQFDSVVYDTNSDAWLYSGTSSAASEYKRLVDGRITELKRDFFRRFIHARLQEGGGFPLNPRSGVFYFVPPSVLPVARKLERLFENLDCGCELLILEINGDEATAGTVKRIVSKHIRDGHASLKERMAAFRAATRAPRQTALQSAVTEFKQLKAEAEMYRDLLGLELTSINDDLAEASELVKEWLGLRESGMKPKIHSAIRDLREGAKLSESGESRHSPQSISEAGLPDSAAVSIERWWVKGEGVKYLERMNLSARADGNELVLSPLG